MINSPKVYIIILNWNGLEDTLACLESVMRLDYDNFRVLLVDNASSDNSVEAIKNIYPDMEMIVNVENLGFTGGNNIGICYALKHGADYVWLLNNDTETPKDTLAKLVGSIQHNDAAGLASPIIRYHDRSDRIQNAGSIINIKTLSMWSLVRGSERLKRDECLCLWGTALLIKRTVIENVGLLNPDYFAYWEDTEYCVRAKKNGFSCMVDYSSSVYHKNQLVGDNASKSKYYFYYMNRNLILMGRQHVNFFYKFAFYKNIISMFLRNTGTCRSYNDGEYLKYYLNGFWHGFLGQVGVATTSKPMPGPIVSVCSFISRCYPYVLADIVDMNFNQIFKIFRNRFYKLFNTTK